jgi:hypothetical protein
VWGDTILLEEKFSVFQLVYEFNYALVRSSVNEGEMIGQNKF